MIIKVCGITRLEDALCAQDAGADMIGFVFAPSPRQVSAQQAKQIISQLSGDVKTVGVFTQPREEILNILQQVDLDMIQLHGDQPEELTAELGAERVIRAFRVRDAEVLQRAQKSQGTLLLDAYCPSSAGGTGTSFDWNLLEGCTRPYILSGGLNPVTVTGAVSRFHPYGLDVSSGVESAPGIKDHTLIKEFITNAKRAK